MLFFGGAAIVLLCLIGWLLAYGVSFLASLPDVNYPLLLAWRVLLYTTVLVFWKPFVLRMAEQQRHANTELSTALIKQRPHLIIYMLIFELVIVQNLPGQLLTLLVE